MLIVFTILSIAIILAGVVMAVTSDYFGEFLWSLFIGIIGGILLLLVVDESVNPTQKDTITVTSKNNITFSLKIDNSDIKLEKDSLNYHDLDSIVKSIIKTK